MNGFDLRFSRRAFVGAFGLGATFAAYGAFAEELTRTPAQTEGPFYPDELPLDRDNDLVIVKSDITPAVGQITHLTGRILNSRGEPVKNAVIEIWQVDGKGVYLHTQCPGREARDPHFQGYGKFETNSKGEYRFRTVKPVPYPGRAPHIHVKVSKGDKELLTSQCYVKGEPGNEKDGIYRSLKDPKDRAALTVPFLPREGSRIKELDARWDIVLGITPEA